MPRRGGDNDIVGIASVYCEHPDFDSDNDDVFQQKVQDMMNATTSDEVEQKFKALTACLKVQKGKLTANTNKEVVDEKIAKLTLQMQQRLAELKQGGKSKRYKKYEDRTMEELKALCKKKKLSGYSKITSKSALIAFIRSH